MKMASANAWAAFDELLINQVQENDIIYNKTNKEFKDANLKKRTWKIIAEAIGSTGMITVVYYPKITTPTSRQPVTTQVSRIQARF